MKYRRHRSNCYPSIVFPESDCNNPLSTTPNLTGRLCSLDPVVPALAKSAVYPIASLDRPKVQAPKPLPPAILIVIQGVPKQEVRELLLNLLDSLDQTVN